MEPEEQERPSFAITAEERAAWAERRHLFWRSRCMEHARTIDKQLEQIHTLKAEIARLEKLTGASQDFSAFHNQPITQESWDNGCRGLGGGA